MGADMAHPLAATLARVAALEPHLAAEVGAVTDGWFGAPALLCADSAQLAEGLAREVAAYPLAQRRVAGSFFIGHYAWYLAGAAIACYLAEQRVPDLNPANVAWRFSSYTWHAGEHSGVAERLDLRLLYGRYAALPSDPLADLVDALVLPTAEALRQWLRQQIEQHLALLIDLIAMQTRLGKTAQWAIVADTIAHLFQHLGTQLNNAEAARAEALHILQSPGSPLRAANTGYLTLDHQGHCESFVRRGGCCLFYKVAPGNNCSTCVLRPEAQRTQLLLEYMASKYSLVG